VRRWLIVTSVGTVVAVVAVLAAVSIVFAKRSGDFGSCTAQRQMAVVDGETVALEDRVFLAIRATLSGRTDLET
jgi:hypothetical protein